MDGEPSEKAGGRNDEQQADGLLDRKPEERRIRSLSVKSLYKNPKNKAYREATTAASVGVNHPVKIPPMMMTGVRRGKNASRMLATNSLKSALLALGRLYRFAKNAMAAIMAMAINPQE